MEQLPYFLRYSDIPRKEDIVGIIKDPIAGPTHMTLPLTEHQGTFTILYRSEPFFQVFSGQRMAQTCQQKHYCSQ